MKLQRLADQLHMQKKALDHREFDLENFGGEAPDVLERKRAELREREHDLDRREAELSARERDLDQRQSNFRQWMREQEMAIEQRLTHTHTHTHTYTHSLSLSLSLSLTLLLECQSFILVLDNQ